MLKRLAHVAAALAAISGPAADRTSCASAT